MRGPFIGAQVCALVVFLSSSRVAAAESCGVASLFDMCVLSGRALSQAQRQRMVDAYPAEEASMLDIRQAAETLRLPLVGVRATLEELGHVSGPKIIHVTDPAHFLVAARISS